MQTDMTPHIWYVHCHGTAQW